MTVANSMVSGPVTEAMLPRPFRVISHRFETPDTVTLELEPDDGADLSFAPGQFTMLYVFGVGEVPISISGDPHRPEILVHTVRSVGAVTAAIAGLGIGDRVGIRGPYGVGWPVGHAEGRDLVVVAGGIGLAPLRPVVYDVIARRDRFGAVSIVYGSRSPIDLMFQEELHSWRSRFDLQIEVTVDRSDESWFGDVGVVTGLLPRIPFDPERAVAMLCGPEIMMKVVANELETRGVAPENVYVSVERNMKCAIGFCGHCQFGSDFLCRDGPVLAYAQVSDRLRVPEL
ncbi:MAG TPA: FAD/NAD(P)-binding protein [Acidimicrobiia bacterium]|jgi:NAD(P)H-flavin reductase